jgi:hypothetical protein
MFKKLPVAEANYKTAFGAQKTRAGKVFCLKTNG